MACAGMIGRVNSWEQTSTDDANKPMPLVGTSRRRALLMMGLATVAAGQWTMHKTFAADATAPQNGRSGADAAALDEALRLLQKQEPRSKQGLSTHAPVVAEALCALGLAELAVPCIGRSHDRRAQAEPRPRLPRCGGGCDWAALKFCGEVFGITR